jgi:hypothetical protein
MRQTHVPVHTHLLVGCGGGSQVLLAAGIWSSLSCLTAAAMPRRGPRGSVTLATAGSRYERAMSNESRSAWDSTLQPYNR